MKLSYPTDAFKVQKSEPVVLSEWPTKTEELYESKNHYKELLSQSTDELKEIQRLFYAYNRYALLIIFQGMDAAGKDSIIRHVMSGINPQGCKVHSFKQPSESELAHDFLWRTHNAAPPRGHIGIFNRSYYEEVLIAKVHPHILGSQNLPPSSLNRKNFWEGRYRSILESEQHLYRSGTRVLKFFLHLSKKEQKNRFLSRIDEPHKNWKFALSDIEERKHWNKYQKAYAECLSNTSSAEAPWYIIPADDKLNSRLMVSQIILENLQALKMHYPRVSSERKKELQAIRKKLT